jgi:4-amino-4-deoxychorismate lyase
VTAPPDTVLVDGVVGAGVSPRDRGLCYGDGLFETVLLIDGHAPLWSRHMLRLATGCARLQLPPPDATLLWREALIAAADRARAVVRITLTRGVGPRGYAPAPAPQVTRIVHGTVAPQIPADWYAHGIRVRCCATRLARQPLLAGIKHLNRLEQVLARAEWDDAAIGEGLVGDVDGYVIGATAANVFVVLDGRLTTPAVDRCGVAGVARAELLARHADVVVREMVWEELMRADEMFLSSSVRGIVPVSALPDRALAVGPQTRALQAEWRALGLLPGAA